MKRGLCAMKKWLNGAIVVVFRHTFHKTDVQNGLFRMFFVIWCNKSRQQLINVIYLPIIGQFRFKYRCFAIVEGNFLCLRAPRVGLSWLYPNVTITGWCNNSVSGSGSKLACVTSHWPSSGVTKLPKLVSTCTSVWMPNHNFNIKGKREKVKW